MVFTNRKWPRIERLMLRLTVRIWNRRISHILNLHFSKGTINSHQLHALAAEFDPTQHGLNFQTWWNRK